MSRLKVESLRHPNASTDAFTLAADGSVEVENLVPNVQLGNRNLVYNGAMQVAQRGTSTASITSSGYYTADRWNFGVSSLGTWTNSVENDAPTGSGLSKSLKLLCTTANASPGSSAFATVRQSLEGYDVQRLANGSDTKQQLTVSFWVKSNVTGTYVLELNDFDNNRQVSLTYTVDASATWERKVITFPADSTGSLDNDNAASFRVQWWLGSGSDFSSGTLQTTWATSNNADRAAGQTNLAAATNNYWQITGVQLEVGPVATPFEFEDYGTTLRKCQRYFRVLNSGEASGVFTSTSAGYAAYNFSPMRIDPSETIPAGPYTNWVDQSGTSFRTPTSITSYGGSSGSLVLALSGMSSATVGHFLLLLNGSGILLSAEL